MLRCYCGNAHLDPEHADFVIDGRPLCDAKCYTRFQAAVEIINIIRDARAARDVAAGTSWAFIEHRNQAQVMADEAA